MYIALTRQYKGKKEMQYNEVYKMKLSDERL